MPTERLSVACGHCGYLLAEGMLTRAYASQMVVSHLKMQSACAAEEKRLLTDRVCVEHVRVLPGQRAVEES